ncbi:hypothetical protein CF386_11455 [Paraphotobacterium marinum]|uniref:DNA gyrase subunit B n=1 Tax=Paraphotobacterium marinum TaxID=1755811 RepID=A0A220VI74_9GAMM|nr:hypothetical protein [Paraphotobacterium marinum]ASK79663.1 hypothetical protein CF386_11455 [Paraphotobacterium marinum]
MKFLSVLISIIYFIYPFIILYTFQYNIIGVIIPILIIASFTRWYIFKKSNNKYLTFISLSSFICLILLYLLMILKKNNEVFLYYPVLINFSLSFIFFFSLTQKQTIIEIFAKLKDPHIDERGIKYIRKLTIVWGFFCFFNGCISLITTFLSLNIWAIYNGFLSYIFIGLFFIVELCIRYRYKNANK